MHDTEPDPTGRRLTEVGSLEVYREAMLLGEQVWSEVVKWDYFARDTLGKQLVRCLDSVAANIAEGYGRYHFAENRNFCFYARGSLEESLTFLQKATNRGLINAQTSIQLTQDLQILRKRLNAYIRSIGPKQN